GKDERHDATLAWPGARRVRHNHPDAAGRHPRDLPVELPDLPAVRGNESRAGGSESHSQGRLGESEQLRRRRERDPASTGGPSELRCRFEAHPFSHQARGPTGANAEPAHHHPAPRLGNGDRHKPARESAPRLLQGRRAELCSVGFGSRHRDYRESPAPERAADPAGVQQGAGVRGRDIPKAARHRAARRRQAPRQPLRRRILLSDAHGRRGGDRMTAETKHRRREKGIALVYVGVFLVPLLICTGLAVDLGRGYLVRVALAKAVDATALAVARNISKADSGLGIANNIFSANFPPNFLGVTPSPQPNIDIKVDDADGSYVINVKSTATVQTTFMRLAKFDTLAVGVGAVARRRLVDMSFVIDRSASLGSAFPQVQEAAIDFVRDGFTQDDRIALITFSGGTKVEDPMTAERGFDEDKIISDIRGASPSGPTATA